MGCQYIVSLRSQIVEHHGTNGIQTGPSVGTYETPQPRDFQSLHYGEQTGTS